MAVAAEIGVAAPGDHQLAAVRGEIVPVGFVSASVQHPVFAAVDGQDPQAAVGKISGGIGGQQQKSLKGIGVFCRVIRRHHATKRVPADIPPLDGTGQLPRVTGGVTFEHRQIKGHFTKHAGHAPFPQRLHQGRVGAAFHLAAGVKYKPCVGVFRAENHIIINGTLIEQPNDHYSIKYLLNDLKETFDILIEMQEKFGERRNYREIQKRIDEMIIIADSGYFTDENMYALEQEKITEHFIDKRKMFNIKQLNSLSVLYEDIKKHKYPKLDKNENNKDDETFTKNININKKVKNKMNNTFLKEYNVLSSFRVRNNNANNNKLRQRINSSEYIKRNNFNENEKDNSSSFINMISDYMSEKDKKMNIKVNKDLLIKKAIKKKKNEKHK